MAGRKKRSPIRTECDVVSLSPVECAYAAGAKDAIDRMFPAMKAELDVLRQMAACTMVMIECQARANTERVKIAAMQVTLARAMAASEPPLTFEEFQKGKNK